MDKENLTKLVDFIHELCGLPENEWFYEKLKSRLISNSQVVNNKTQLNEIYEYCLESIMKEHSEHFYRDFKLVEIKSKLAEDFVRMERFRRADNFEDFCLAAYQQIELIVNTLILPIEFREYFIVNKDSLAMSKLDPKTKSRTLVGNQTIGKFIFQQDNLDRVSVLINAPINDWYFNHKLRAVLFYYYFDKHVPSSYVFESVYKTGNILYIGRNLNHRGSLQSAYQKSIIDVIIPNQHKYYFKFLGYLEEFVTNINKHI